MKTLKKYYSADKKFKEELAQEIVRNFLGEDEYLKGFRDAVIDVEEFGLEFSKQLVHDFKVFNNDKNYCKGYIKGYEMMGESL